MLILHTREPTFTNKPPILIFRYIYWYRLRENIGIYASKDSEWIKYLDASKDYIQLHKGIPNDNISYL